MYTGTVFPNESKIARQIGDDLLDKVKAASHGQYCPVPIAGTGAFTYDGMVVPRIQGGGFSSLSDLISEATTGGKRQEMSFVKTGTAGTVGRSNSLFLVGTHPAGGSAAGALPGGTATTRATSGALKQANPSGSDTLHITTATATASVAGQLLLVYDRLWHGAWNLATAQSQAVASTATRYQTAATAPGNFASVEVVSALGVATPTIAMTYTDQDGATGHTSTSPAIIASAAANTIPYVTPDWHQPLQAGDTGIRNLTGNIDLSVAATGTAQIFLGHPLAWIPMGPILTPVLMDGINSAFNLAEVLTDACVSFMEVAKSATTATNWWGSLTMVSG